MKKLLFTLIVTSIFCANAFCASPKADKIRITDAGGYYTSTEVEGALQEAGAAAGHNAVTLNTSADTFLNLTGQDLFLDDAPTNKLWGGPASGANTTPTYRAVVDDDIPDTITLTNITQIGTRTSVLLTDTADILYEEELNSLSELTAQITDVSTFLNNGTTFGGEVSGAYGSLVVGNDVLDDQYYDSEADLTTLLDNNYQPLEATLTDVADGTIAEDLVNTANPWADNEVADDITLTNITQITTRTSTLLTDTADLLYETELSNVTELNAQISETVLYGGALTNTKYCIANGTAGLIDCTAEAGAGSGDLLADATVPMTADWDIGNFDITLKSLTGDGTIEGAALTEGGEAVYNSTETPGGELGGSWASPTIDDSVAVTGWNLTTPTLTTSLTTDSKTISEAEIGRLDGLTSAIIDDDKIDTFSELDTIVTDKALVNKADGAVWTGTHDFGGATAVEIENTAGDVVVSNLGEVAVDTTQKQLVVYDGVEKVIPLRHIIQGQLGTGDYDADPDVFMLSLHADTYPDGILITQWTVDCNEADPTTELNANLYYCDDRGTGSFPGASPELIDVIDTATGNSSENTMGNSDLGSGIIPTGKELYVIIDTDPTSDTTLFRVKVHFYIPED